MSDKQNSVTFYVGLFAGVSLAIAFYLGHQFWPIDSTIVNNSLEHNKIDSGNAIKMPTAQKLPNGQIPICQNTISDIASCVSGAVVNIDISKTITVTESPLQMPFNDFEFFFGPNQSPFGMVPQPRKFEKKGSGSGFIIRSDGFILTNNHVVGQADDIVVTLNDKRKFKGKVWGRDSYSDLALVKIDLNNLPVVKLGSSKVTLWSRPNGEPIAMTKSPGRISFELPNLTTGKLFKSILTKAKSL